MVNEDDTTKSDDTDDTDKPLVVIELSEEDQKRIFSCIPALVEEIEKFIEKSLNSGNVDHNNKIMFYAYIKYFGIKLDQNNRVVKIKYDARWLQSFLLDNNIITPKPSSIPNSVYMIPNPYTFYIGSYRDGVDGEPNSPNSLKSSDSDDSLDSSGSSDSRKVFAKFSKKHTKDVKSVGKLGEGTFGKVQLVITGDQKVAMKKINLTLSNTKEIENEIQALKIMGQYKDHQIIDGYMYIYMDYIPGVSLQDKLNPTENTSENDQGKLQETEKFLIADKLVDELDKLHKEGFFHRDIKPGNVIYDANGQKATFIDFGSTKKFVSGKTLWSDIEESVSGSDGMSPGYIPPESDMTNGRRLEDIITAMPKSQQQTPEEEEKEKKLELAEYEKTKRELQGIVDLDDVQLEIVDPSDPVELNDIKRGLEEDFRGTDDQKNFLEKKYAQYALAKIDIYQLGMVFKDMGLPEQLWASMIATDPLQRPSLEEVKQNIQKYKDSLSQQQEQSLSVNDKLRQLQKLENSWSQNSPTLQHGDTREWPDIAFKVEPREEDALVQNKKDIVKPGHIQVSSLEDVKQEIQYYKYEISLEDQQSQYVKDKLQQLTELHNQLLAGQQSEDLQNTQQRPATFFEVENQDKGNLQRQLSAVAARLKAPIVVTMQNMKNQARQKLDNMTSKIKRKNTRSKK